jgi:hypothetical protein
VEQGQLGCVWPRYLAVDELGTMLTQLNPWSRDLIEKLIVPQLVKKYLLFYGT